MKAKLVILSLMTIVANNGVAKEMLAIDDGYDGFIKYVNTDYSKNTDALSDNEKDMKIVNLSKLLEQQQRLYEDKINYLEDELKKSKNRLVEKSINQDKVQDTMQRRYAEETSFLKRELVAKTKTLMEYQRQLEKIKPTEDMKELIKVNTELALELRKSADEMALIKLKGSNLATKPENFSSGGRKPASVSK